MSKTLKTTILAIGFAALVIFVAPSAYADEYVTEIYAPALVDQTTVMYPAFDPFDISRYFSKKEEKESYNSGELLVRDPDSLTSEERSHFENSAINDRNNGEIIVASDVAFPRGNRLSASVGQAGMFGSSAQVNYGGLLLILVMLAIIVMLARMTMRKRTRIYQRQRGYQPRRMYRYHTALQPRMRYR